MRAKDLMEELLGWSPQSIPDTVDTCKAGDPEREIHRVAFCFIATPEVIRKAAQWGADLLITHEPTYYDHQDEICGREGDPVISVKKRMMEQSGMVLWRFHDHLHARLPDGIVEGELKKLGWKGSYDGRFGFILEEARTPRCIARQLEKAWGVSHIRMIGAVDAQIKNISLLIGAPGKERMMQALFGQTELLIGGEVCEWMCGEYARDAAQLGMRKAILICGHAGSERAGMEHVKDLVEQTHGELCCAYFESGETYQKQENL